MKTMHDFTFARGTRLIAATTKHISNGGAHNLMFNTVSLSVFPTP
jgi:hypothetical protein